MKILREKKALKFVKKKNQEHKNLHLKKIANSEVKIYDPFLFRAKFFIQKRTVLDSSDVFISKKNLRTLKIFGRKKALRKKSRTVKR